MLNALNINSNFPHTVFTAFFKFGNFSAFVSDIWHPSPPLFRGLLKNDHLSDFLIKNVFSSCSFFFPILITAIFLTKVAILRETERTVFSMIHNFQIDKRVYCFIELLEIVNEFVGSSVVYFNASITWLKVKL